MFEILEALGIPRSANSFDGRVNDFFANREKVSKYKYADYLPQASESRITESINSFDANNGGISPLFASLDRHRNNRVIQYATQRIQSIQSKESIENYSNGVDIVKKMIAALDNGMPITNELVVKFNKAWPIV
jgi:hypothetical protein